MDIDNNREPGAIDFDSPHFVYLRLIQGPEGENSPEANAYWDQHKDYPGFVSIAARHRLMVRLFAIIREASIGTKP